MLAVAARTRSFPVLMPETRAHDHARAGRRRARLTPLGRAVAAALLMVVPAIAYVAQSTAAAHTGYTILSLQQEIESLQGENARLVAAVTALKSPERIERVALGTLGMLRPSPSRMAVLTVPAPAAAMPVASAPTLWQRVGTLLLGHEAAASER